MANPEAQLHVLVVDDDARLRRLLKDYLTKQGYFVSTAAQAREARELLALFEFDALVLDVMMPGESGIALAKSLPPEYHAPILMLSAMSDPQDRIAGLEAGVDDYLVKPFEPRELLLRLQAILRRTGAEEVRAREVHFGPFVFDLQAKILLEDGTAIHLTDGEAMLLHALASQAGEAVSREELARALGSADAASERGVDVQIMRLRKKIEKSESPQYLRTVRGSGYKLQP